MMEGKPDEVTYHTRRGESMLEILVAGAMLGGTLWYAWRMKDQGPVKTVEITQPDGTVINVPLLPANEPTPAEEFHGTADEPGPGNVSVKNQYAQETFAGVKESEAPYYGGQTTSNREEEARIPYYQATEAVRTEERTKGSITITTTTTPVVSSIKTPPTLQPSVSATQTSYTTGAVSSAEARNAQRDRG